MDKPKKLSICYPVYNRANIFELSLEHTCTNILDLHEDVEIIISDNSENDSIKNIVKNFINKYKKLTIKYHKNDTNIGLAKNFLKTVELSSAEFCWIVGSDDFIKVGAVDKILTILSNHNEIDFIGCNFDSIQLHSEINTDFLSLLKDKMVLKESDAPKWSKRLEKFEELLDPQFKNVFLGSIMLGIFRKDLWDKVDKSHINWGGFNSLESIYPHIYIYAHNFLDSNAYYCGFPLITIGNGVREWSTEMGNTMWQSSLPYIYLNVLWEAIFLYRSKGSSSETYRKSRKHLAKIYGNLFLPFLWNKYLIFRKINNRKITNLRYLRFALVEPVFYIMVFRSILKSVFITIFGNTKKNTKPV